MDGFRIATAFVEVRPDTEGFKEKLQAALDEAVEGVRAAAKVTLDTSDLDTKADEAKARLGELNAARAQPHVTLDDSRIVEGLDHIAEKLDELDGSVNDVRLTIEDEGAGDKLDDIRAQLDELNEKTARPKLDLDDEEFRRKLSEDKAAADSAGDGGGLFGGHGLLLGIGSGVAGLLPGIGGAAAGLGLLGAAAGLGLGGVAKAVDAAHQAAQNIGMTQQQLAATEFANAVQIQQAQQSVGQAHQQAAQDAEQAAAQIESAQTSLAETERNTAQQIIQAQQAVTMAQQQLADSQYNEKEAQYQLTQAWIQAREQLVALNDAEQDAALNVTAAQLAVQQAVVNQQQADQNAMTTSLQRQEAALAVAQAQQQLVEAQHNQVNAAQAADQANQQGVAGSQTVVQAQHAVTDAVNGTGDAQASLKDAQTALVNAQLNGAAQVKQAQLAVAQAQEQAAYTQMRDAQAVANAQQNLTNTIKEQRLQWAATMASQNQAAQQFQRDMARLTPDARGLVDQILGMRGAVTKVQQTIENALAPGLSTWLAGIQKLLPSIGGGIEQMARGMSGAFGQFGKLLASPAFAQILDGLIANGIRFANIVLPAISGFVTELMKAGSLKGAVDGIANLLGGLANGLTGLLKGLEPAEGAFSSIFTTLGTALADIGPPLGQVIGALAQALAPALKDLLPAFETIVATVGSNFAGIFKAAGPLLVPFAQAIVKIAQALAPVSAQFAGMISQLLPQFLPLLQGLVPVVGQIAQLLAQGMAQGLTQVTQAVIPLLPQIVQIAVDLLPLISAMIKVDGWFTKTALNMTGPLLQAMTVIIKPILAVADAIVKVAGEWKVAWDAIQIAAVTVWQDGIQPVFRWIASGAEAVVSGVATTWDKLRGAFLTPVNFLIKTVYDDGIRKLWNDVVGAVGLGSLDLPDIPALASGGIVPGRDRGVDSQLVRMRPGEGVLVPEAVRGIGGAPAIDALNSRFGRGGGRTGIKDGLPAFGGGGLLGDVGSIISGVGSTISGLVGKAIDTGKLVAALMSGNTTAFTNAFSSLIGTPAAGDLAKVMTGIPVSLVGDLGRALIGMLTGGGSKGTSASSSAVGELPANYQQIAGYLAGHGFTRYAAAGVTGNIDAESGGNPEQLEIGGGGGGGLIQWTPYPASYITGNAGADMITQLMGLLTWGGGPGLVNTATSPSNAAAIYQDDYEKPADLVSSLPRRMASANAVYKAMGWGSGTFDQGGWLTAGTVPVNRTGRPEAVLNPGQSDAFVELMEFVRQMKAANGTAPANGVLPPIQFVYNGTQQPTAEQRAWQMRDLALALGGATP